MSRIGKVPIPVPAGVDIKIDRNEIIIKGPKGTLSLVTSSRVTVSRQDKALVVERHGDDKSARAFHGTTQRLVRNMVIGVTDGFKRDLEMSGVGYKAELKDGKLVLGLGFSHPVEFIAPPGVKIEVPKPTTISISGHDKQQVGQVASVIRGFRPPEPYKGKGVRYSDEVVRRKEGKKNTK